MGSNPTPSAKYYFVIKYLFCFYLSRQNKPPCVRADSAGMRVLSRSQRSGGDNSPKTRRSLDRQTDVRHATSDVFPPQLKLIRVFADDADCFSKKRNLIFLGSFEFGRVEMNVLRRIIAAFLGDDGAPSLYSGLVIGAVYGRRDERND
ncbi:hypothetical protein [Rhodoblastus acidophilus]|nr:hypothetical protein [Rhodoblastus acidophilus]